MSDPHSKPNDRSATAPVHPYYPFLKWGFLHTPFMIYVRSYNTLSDNDLMEALGLRDYRHVSPPVSPSNLHVVFANDTAWTHIADDYYYTLWHSPKTYEAIEELSKRYDVFYNWIGDIDESFAFTYYQDGKLMRRFVCDHDIVQDTCTITGDTGTRLRGESVSFDDLRVAAEKMFPMITQALDIRRVTDPLQYRIYSKNVG